MPHFNKEKILNDAKQHLAKVIEVIIGSKKETDDKISKIKQRLKTHSTIDFKIESTIMEMSQSRSAELETLSASPYFTKCEVEFDGESHEDIYFGKFQYSDLKIYSWVSPIARIRFENMGGFTFHSPSGTAKTGLLKSKDQFLIVNGKIVFMADETIDHPRELIYQEYLSQRKTDFILPEIVAKMEKRQDEVIRADYKGPFLIAGPAGSGKTTLALHRVAYLVQSPDINQHFPPENIIVFVQDENTKSYFSSLLPQLGIHNIEITTYPEWALKILDLEGYSFISRFGNDDTEKNLLEFEKSRNLKVLIFKKSRLSLIRILENHYQKLSNLKVKSIINKQLREKKLDRFDLSFLLMQKLKNENGLNLSRRVVAEDKFGNSRLKTLNLPIKYSCIVVDEAENYLANDLEILKSVTNENDSLLYVGDLAQRTRIGTINDWNEAGESFSDDRHVKLDKVYRNSQAILDCLIKQGYEASIPKEFATLGEVKEYENMTEKEAIEYIAGLVSRDSGQLIGIISFDSKRSDRLKQHFSSYKNLRCLNIYEAQGVEFETVILFDDLLATPDQGLPQDFQSEQKRINRDLKYVGLTRAIEKLYIIKI